MKLSFNRNYFIVAAILFITEVFIALFITDRFVRPYLGDVFVVMLIYCFIKSFCDLPVIPLAIGVLLFSFLIEYLQYIHMVEILGIQKSRIARTVLGTSFAWNDILAYIAGAVITVAVELGIEKSRQ